MSKYIRTTAPANIHSLKPTFIVDRTDVTCFKTHGNKGRYVNDTIETEENLEKWLKYNKTNILKQADTIEKLIDGYVIVDIRNKKNKPRFQEEPYMKPPLHLLKDGYEIYGAIWTDEGLIYAARMNDKGELELL